MCSELKKINKINDASYKKKQWCRKVFRGKIKIAQNFL